MEGKRVVWTDVTKESALLQLISLDLTATTVGEVDDFMEILHKIHSSNNTICIGEV